MNRLSKDIYEVDILLPKDIFEILFQIGLIIVSAIATALICNLKTVPIVFVYFFLSIFLTFFFLNAKRQVVRIGKIFYVKIKQI